MANLDLDEYKTDIAEVRRLARRHAHVHWAQIMLMAALLATLGIVGVAGALLSSAF